MKTNYLQIAIEVNEIKVIELLKLRGGVLPSLPPIVKKKRKKTRRPTSTYRSCQSNIETSLSQDKCLYTMVRINEDGSKIPLTKKEILDLKYTTPIIKSLLENNDKFKKEVKRQCEKLQLNEGLINNWKKQATELMKELWK